MVTILWKDWDWIYILTKLQERETMVLDTQQSEAPN